MGEEKEKTIADVDIVESAIDDLLDEKIDETQNILGHRWLSASMSSRSTGEACEAYCFARSSSFQARSAAGGGTKG
jgi:hypothetical protein